MGAPTVWSRIALLAPIAALSALLAAFCLSAGGNVASGLGYFTVVAAPAVFTWIGVDSGSTIRRIGLAALATLVSLAVAVTLVRVVLPSLDTGEGIPGGSLQAFVLLPSFALLAGSLLAALESAPPLDLVARGHHVRLYRSYPNHAALLVLWVVVGLLGWLAEPISLWLTEVFHNDAIAALAVVAAPSVALGTWLGTVVAAMVNSRLFRSHRPQAAT